jgi:site-specific DNA-methyltransferase (adenine-specific)
VEKIICCDCVVGMKEIEDKSIDLSVTSPPYDNLRTYEGFSFNHEEIIQQLYRVTKDGGVVVWVVGDATINGSETGTSFKQALFFKETGFNLHDTMIYYRNAVTHPDKIRYYNCFQYMFVFSKGQPKTVNLIKDHKNKTVGKKGTSTKQREKDGKFIERWDYKTKKVRGEYSARWNIWQYDTGSLVMADDRLWVKHPAIFPLKLAEDHIKTWSNPGDLVLDPMCGSGQTLIAAKKLSRNFIGLDISEKYCALSLERLALYKSI